MINRIADAATVAAGRWRWRKARSLTGLANLQADRIARNLADLADGDVGPKWSMYSALVALGRAGVVVADWRPGTTSYEIGRHTMPMETRAAVTGFADDQTKDWLDNLLHYARKESGATKYRLDSVFDLYAPGNIEYDRSGGDDNHRKLGSWVERIDGVATARIGGQMNASQVHRAFPTRPSLQQALREAWQITICAPTWGDGGGRMFADLLPLLRDSRRQGVSTTS
jgi:hypothetical protein